MSKIGYKIRKNIQKLKINTILSEKFTGILNPTLITFWISGQTDISTVEYQPMMCLVNEFFGDVFDELFFSGQWCGRSGC